jgi:hypothetical protein
MLKQATTPMFFRTENARTRIMAMTAAGCFYQWEPTQNEDGHYNDSHYLWFIQAEAIAREWGFDIEECNQAWKAFLNRNKGQYPNGDWKSKEREYLDALTSENKNQFEPWKVEKITEVQWWKNQHLLLSQENKTLRENLKTPISP